MTTETGPERSPRAPWRVASLVGPLLLAAFQLVGTLRADEADPGRRPVDALTVLLVLAGPAALVGLRRRPVAVLWFVVAVILTYLWRGYANGPVFVSLVVATVVTVALGHRRAAWLAAGTAFAGHFAIRTFVHDDSWSWPLVLGVTAWALLALVGGEVARVRRERGIEARQARAETARRQANEERLRIARELHDVVALHMSLINVQAGVALHLVDRRPEQAQTALAAIKDASHEALVELRSLVGVLRDESEAAPRAPASMLGSLDELVERSGHAGLVVRTRLEGDVRPLPATVELAAFRILQESVTNVVRHAGAGHADIGLDYGTDVLRVQVDDDGRGARGPLDLDEGSGIRGMRERAAALGGTLTVSASPAGGLRVRVELALGTDR